MKCVGCGSEVGVSQRVVQNFTIQSVVVEKIDAISHILHLTKMGTHGFRAPA